MKTTSLSKRFLAMLTVIAMLASFFAMSAFAVEDSSIPASGYAAVGIVDKESHKAEILLADGTQGTVYYNGADPIANGFYTYTRDGNNLYTFTDPVDVNNGNQNANQHYGTLMWYHSSGWFWTSNYDHFYPYSNPMFVRYGDNKWSIKSINETINPGAMYVFTYVLGVDSSSGQNIPAVTLMGGMTGNGTIDTTGFETVLGSLEAEYDLSAFTTALHADVNLDAIILETGYAAIGYVDTASHKVEILKADGTQGSVYYTGEAPRTDAVYRYSRGAGNLYTFTNVLGNSGYSDQLATGWNYYYTPNGWMWAGNGPIYFPNSSPIFVRYGNGGWALSSLSSFADAGTWVYGYMLDEYQTDAANNYWAVGAIVIGGYTNGTVDTTNFDVCLPNVSATNSLSSFTTDLHTNVALDKLIVDEGYAAVGYVNTTTSQANILLANGQTATVSFTGIAPTAGAVYKYSKTAAGVYTFTLPVANSGNGDVIADTGVMEANPSADYGGYIWGAYPTDYHHFWYDGVDIPVFVRLSATQWAIADETRLTTTYPNTVPVYLLDVAARANSPETYHTMGAMLINAYNADGSANAAVYGESFPMGQIVDLGETSTAGDHDGKISASINGVPYDSLQKAVELSLNNYAYLSLQEDALDTTIVIPEDKFLLLDLNGHTLGKVISNGGLYAIDNSTRDYTNENYGKILVAEGNVASIQRTDDTTKGHAYNGFAAYWEGTSVSFHYFEIKIASVVLRASETGLGYKMHMAGNAQVKALLNESDAFGVTVYLDGHEDNGKSASAGAGTFQVGEQTKMVMIKNILCGNSAEENAAYGQMKICVKGYIQLGDQKIEITYAAGRSLRDMVETANGKLGTYDDVQTSALKAMYVAYDLGNTAFAEWSTGNIAALVNG